MREAALDQREHAAGMGGQRQHVVRALAHRCRDPLDGGRFVGQHDHDRFGVARPRMAQQLHAVEARTGERGDEARDAFFVERVERGLVVARGEHFEPLVAQGRDQRARGLAFDDEHRVRRSCRHAREGAAMAPR